jgi:hypothetical protein
MADAASRLRPVKGMVNASDPIVLDPLRHANGSAMQALILPVRGKKDPPHAHIP